MALIKKLTKIGNSLGVILPTDILKVAGIDEKTKVEVSVKENQIIIEPADRRHQRIMKIFTKVMKDYNETFKKLAE